MASGEQSPAQQTARQLEKERGEREELIMEKTIRETLKKIGVTGMCSIAWWIAIRIFPCF